LISISILRERESDVTLVETFKIPYRIKENMELNVDGMADH